MDAGRRLHTIDLGGAARLPRSLPTGRNLRSTARPGAQKTVRKKKPGRFGRDDGVSGRNGVERSLSVGVVPSSWVALPSCHGPSTTRPALKKTSAGKCWPLRSG
jgi:hypothetical protein